jgi:hypothetical protein
MAAVVAIKDEQLFTLAQTGHRRDLRLGRGGVLGQDVASPGRDDPAPARPRQHAQAARSHRSELSAAHVLLSGSRGDDDCGSAQPELGEGSSEMLGMVP